MNIFAEVHEVEPGVADFYIVTINDVVGNDTLERPTSLKQWRN